MKGVGYKPRTPGTVHETLALAYEQAGGVKTVADVLPGRNEPWLYAASNQDAETRQQARFTLEEARLMTRAFPGKVFAFAFDFATLAGGFFVPPMAAASGPIGALAAKAGQENAEALQKIFTAYSDGVLTTAEAREALPEVRQAIEAATELYRALCEVAGVKPDAAP